jgi:hypothetical protein
MLGGGARSGVTCFSSRAFDVSSNLISADNLTRSLTSSVRDQSRRNRTMRSTVNAISSKIADSAAVQTSFCPRRSDAAVSSASKSANSFRAAALCAIIGLLRAPGETYEIRTHRASVSASR